MRPFSPAELARMQATNESSMFDRCDLLVLLDGGVDAHGMPLSDWSILVSDEPCGYNASTTTEVQGESQMEQTDGKIRLSIDWDAQIDTVDRVRLTNRHGVSLSPTLLFNVVGAPMRGPTGLVLNVRRVLDGSI